MISDRIGDRTRIRSLVLRAGRGSKHKVISFSEGGMAIPMIDRPSVLFQELFGVATDKKRAAYSLESGVSVLDAVLDQAHALETTMSPADRRKFDEYLTSVRAVEKDVKRQRRWLEEPIRTPQYDPPKFDPVAPVLMLECEQAMFDLMFLALQADVTRIIAFLIPGGGQVFTIDGRKMLTGYHSLSHHVGGDEGRRDLMRVEAEHMQMFAGFCDKLKAVEDGDGTMLDSTIAVLGTIMGQAAIHENRNAPLLVAGGGFRHRGHVNLQGRLDDPEGPRLSQLFATFLQQLGIEEDHFGEVRGDLNQHLA